MSYSKFWWLTTCIEGKWSSFCQQRLSVAYSFFYMKRRHLLVSLATAGMAGCIRLSDSNQGSSEVSPTPMNVLTSTASTSGKENTDVESTETKTKPEQETQTGEESTTEQNPRLAGSWPQHGYDPQNTGYSPVSAPTSGVTHRWETDLGDFPIHSAPAIVDNIIYLTSSGTHAVDAQSGEIVWSNDGGQWNNTTP
jgi:glucose dehydrogenase